MARKKYEMNGFTYPGVSPIKGKRKVADSAAAETRGDSATEGWKDAMSKDIEGTDIMKGNNPKYGEVPFQKRDPLKQPVGSFSAEQKLKGNLVANQELMNKDVSAPKKAFGDSFKGAMGSTMGQAVGEAIIGGVVDLTVGALSNKKKKPTRTGGSATGFSNTKIGRS